MKTLQVIPTIILGSLLFSCKSGSTREAIADSTRVENNISDKIISSSAAVVSNNDSARKFIRTADLKFKVKNVVTSIYDIEDIARKNGGYVTYTNLASNIDNTSNTQVSEDSSLETTFYNVTNSITIKIPNTKLDTTLKEIARNIDYLDYRIIKAEDVALQILSNKLTQKRGESNEQRLTDAIDSKGKKLAETASA